MMRWTFSLAVLASVPAGFQSDAPSILERAARLRNQARAHWSKDSASPADIRKGVDLLNQALAAFDEPRARGDVNLAFRSRDVLWDLAAAYARLGDNEKAFAALRRLIDAGSLSSGDLSDLKRLERGKEFDSLRKEPEYGRILGHFRAQEALWSAAAFKTSYEANLGEDEKVAGLSLFWSEVRYKFANFDLVPGLDWNALYREYLPKVRLTKTTLEYYRVLQDLCARLKDGHTNVYPPSELRDQMLARPLLQTALVEDKVLILAVMDDDLKQRGVRAGMEILEIDGMPIKTYAEQRVAPYESVSTPQDLHVRMYSYRLLSGPVDRAVTLQLQDEQGRRSTAVLPRKPVQDLRKALTLPPFEFKVLEGNVAYVALRAFDTDEAARRFDEVFGSILKTDALILDVRDNSGGNGGVGFDILAHLTDKPFQSASWRTRDRLPETFGASLLGELQWREPAGTWQPKGGTPYRKPVVVLTSARTFSAAEDFCIAFSAMKRGTMIGEPTAGSTGQPVTFALPGGGLARICVKRDRFPDGREFVGIGIPPDIVVRRTVAEVRAGGDRVLQAALRHLNAAK